MKPYLKHLMSFLVLCIYISFFISRAQALNNSVSAIYVFGDSTVDPGNNNHISTIFKSNFRPYGKDFINHTPTGRFTNGRLPTDFVASYVGIKENVPPYLDPTLTIEDLLTGVSFASAGSGFDPLTPSLTNVIGLPKQLEYFIEYRKRLESVIGKKTMEDHIRQAIFVVSAGTNDFVVNYFAVSIRSKSYNISAYQQFVLQNAKQHIQGLWDLGARKIAVAGLPPMGCLPAVITLNSNNANILQRFCIETYSAAARDYNVILQNEVNSMQSNLANLGAKIYYIDIYQPIVDMVQGPQKFEFVDVSSGCCGTGYLEAAFLCNPKAYVCADASKYVFWDSIHPTEKTYKNVFDTIRTILDDFIKD